MKTIKSYFKLFRVKHYLKNILIFLPIIFSGNLFDGPKFLCCVLGFISFCFISSSVYIINDLKDIEKDKKHPIKKTRPLASGKITPPHAVLSLIILLILSIAIQCIIFNLYSSVQIVPAILSIYGYLLLNIFYTFWFKNYPIIDLIALSLGFVLRVLYGGAIIDTQISNYLFIMVLSLSLYAALGKRRNEMIKNGAKSRGVLNYYNKNFLDKNMYLFLGISLVCYILWCAQGTTFIQDDRLIFSSILLFFIVMRYSLIIEGDSLGDPVDVVFGDKILLSSCVLYGILMIGLLYV